MRKKLKNWLTKKLTTKDLDVFLKEYKTDKKTLVANCNDSPYQDYFSNRIKVDNKPGKGTEHVVDYNKLPFPDESFDIVLATGLMEHLKDPWQALQEMKRVLKPGGKVLIGASWVFSLHDMPDNYYHFTPVGMEYMLKKEGWKNVMSKGSCGPMKTIGILLQRIGYQTKSNVLVRIALFLVAKTLPFFDRFIGQEYGDIKQENKVAHMLSSNVHAAAEK